jgi:NCS1 family nucleobase:cation symporter-1
MQTNKSNLDSTVHYAADGRVDLLDEASIAGSTAYNRDLAPIPISRRTWSATHFASLWAGMACNIPTYMIASGLIASGMNWWQALLTVLIGNMIVLVPIVLNSHPGTKYGIPFPILARASYGVRGSNLPALMRALVACGWFGINAWIGGQAVFTLLNRLIPGWTNLLGPAIAGHTPSEWLSFLAFWVLNMLVIFRGMDFLKRFESFAAPFIFSMAAGLVLFLISKAHGLGALLSEPGKYLTIASFLPIFVPSVTAMIGSWSTLSLNMPDFTRFGRSQRDQIVGQVAALPASMTAFAGAGVVATSASLILYPNMKVTELWDPVILVGQFTEPAIVVIAMFTIILATLSVNVTANLVSPANDLANMLPRWISFRQGALITGVVGLLIQPWRLIADPNAYIFSWLLGYAGGLGAIAGVMIVDYWIIRKNELNLPALYLTEGDYWYQNGWNWRAVCATLVGCLFAWVGALIPTLHILYDYSWFVGVGAAAASYYGLMKQAEVGAH